MSKIKIPSGIKIFKEGENNNSMYIILKGKVEISVQTGKVPTLLAVMKEGDFFGEMALFRSKPRTASAKALVDCELATIESKQQLELFLVNNPKFAAKMVAIMAERLANTNELLIEKMQEKEAQKIEFTLDGIERDGSEIPVV